MRPIATKALVAALLGFALPGILQAQPASAASWNRPVRVVRTVLMGVSCPEAQVCVAVSLHGEIVATSAPTSGRARDWHVVRAASGVALRGISCPTARLCVAVGDHGTIVVSEHPTRARTWTRLEVSTSALDAVACPTGRLCVAVDDQGNVLTSTAPATPGSWTTEHIDSGVNYECFHYGTSGLDCQSALQALSCTPMSGVCAASDDSGRVFATSNAAGKTWGASGLAGSLPASQAFTSISCPTTDLCFLVNGDGDMAELDPLTSAQPTRFVSVDRSAGLVAIDCPSITLCVTSDLRGYLWQSHDPSAQTPRWTTATVDHRGYITDIDCPAAKLCIAVDSSGDILAESAARRGRHGQRRS
jgi:hypothetical protein